jgi:hypothetical protein
MDVSGFSDVRGSLASILKDDFQSSLVAVSGQSPHSQNMPILSVRSGYPGSLVANPMPYTMNPIDVTSPAPINITTPQKRYNINSLQLIPDKGVIIHVFNSEDRKSAGFLISNSDRLYNGFAMNPLYEEHFSEIQDKKQELNFESTGEMTLIPQEESNTFYQISTFRPLEQTSFVASKDMPLSIRVEKGIDLSYSFTNGKMNILAVNGDDDD